MKTHRLHPWNVSVAQAKAIQKNLSNWIVTEGSCKNPAMIGRIELACTRQNHKAATVQASISIKSVPALQLLERKVSMRTTEFPDMEGLVAFRKVPAIIAALEKLVRIPDVFICDGRGITGPGSFGVASHVGLITHIPTIGVSRAKPRLLSELLGNERGSWLPVHEPGQVAALVRVIGGLDPLVVSPAHKLGMEDAIEQVLRYVPADTPAREYMQALYPEAGINGRPQLTLVSTKRSV